MKKTILIAIFVSGLEFSYGQNIFPTNGNVGIGTTSPMSYFHGGTNRVLEIFNPNTELHSQSHVILSTGATTVASSGGTISWVSKNSTGLKAMAYIGSSFQEDAATNAAAGLVFATSDGTTIGGRMFIDKNGNVGIGLAAPQEKLSVNGNIRAKEIKVENTNWPDYVFEDNYMLPSLGEVEKYIREKQHLPGIPSSSEVKTNGIDLGEINALLLKKIEDQTLYIIEQNKKIGDMIRRIEILESKR